MSAGHTPGPWSTTDVQRLKTMSGIDALTAASVFGRSPRAVQEAAKRHGANPPRMPHACYWSEAMRCRCLRLRGDGHSLAQISRMTGVPVGTIRHWVYDSKRIVT